MRQYSLIDQAIGIIDRGVVTVFGQPAHERPTPGTELKEPVLTKTERTHSAGLMRVDHCGEVCAQALYLGQALTAKEATTRAAMKQASDEENDHLVWCQQRLKALGSRTSYLNPLWFLGSLSMGLIAGWVGDRWSLGFVAETEQQVTDHLSAHLQALPAQDAKSRAILTQMRIDEAAHATMAYEAGAKSLPTGIKALMRGLSKIMTTLAYWV